MVKLSESEIYIMHVIWEKGRATSFDILEQVKIDKKISENTIRTLLARMVKKKAIAVTEKNSKTYVYEPLINKDEFLEVQGDNFLENVYRGAIKSLMLNFVKKNKLKQNDVEDLLKEIKKTGDNNDR